MGNVQSFQAALGALRQYRSEVLSIQVTQLGIQKTQLAQNYETQRATYISADRGLSGIPDKEFQRLRRAMTSARSEEHTSELQSLMRISYAVFCFKKKNKQH